MPHMGLMVEIIVGELNKMKVIIQTNLKVNHTRYKHVL